MSEYWSRRFAQEGMIWGVNLVLQLRQQGIYSGNIT